MERSDKLRRRPDQVRYHYLAQSPHNLHTGISYGGLLYVLTKHGITSLFLSDLVTRRVIEVTEGVAEFMEKWREHYNDPRWDYEKEKGV